jgi:hypothetical protein
MLARGNVVSRETAGGLLEFFVVDKAHAAILSEFCDRLCQRCEAVVHVGDLCERCSDVRERPDQQHNKVDDKIAFYRCYAENRGMSWHLTNEEAATMIGLPCSLCGRAEAGCIARLTQGNYQ